MNLAVVASSSLPGSVIVGSQGDVFLFGGVQEEEGRRAWGGGTQGIKGHVTGVTPMHSA